MTPPEPESWRIVVGHVSMQFSDTAKQKQADADLIVERMIERDMAWLTSTEVGGKTGPEFRSILKNVMPEAGYRFVYRGGDCWMAIRESLILGNFESDFTKVVGMGDFGTKGKFTNKGVLRASFDAPWGRQTVLASHYLTAGDPSRPDRIEVGRLEGNKAIAAEIGRQARLYGLRSDLCSYGGDQNINDKKADTFLGKPLTSAADATGKHPGTGHGPIDVIAWYDGDGRVECLSWQVLDDDKFPLHTDHLFCEAEYSILPVAS